MRGKKFGIILTTQPLYVLWWAILGRCHTPSNGNYHKYGAKGITVCDRWRFGQYGIHPFLFFIHDMGPRPSVFYEIDRIDNTLGYSKYNCQWLNEYDHYEKTYDNRVVGNNYDKRLV